MRIVVIHGGRAPESAASTKNAQAVQAALGQLGHRVRLVHYDAGLAAALAGGGYDLAFIATQGKGHGDGTCQSICEWLGLAYTGTRAQNAAPVNDKAASKILCAWQNIPTPAFAVYSAKEYAKRGAVALGVDIAEAVGYPAVAKPRSQGGSLGIVLLQGAADAALLEIPFALEDEVLVERFVPGSFVTVGVLEMKGRAVALPPVTAVQGGPGDTPALKGQGLQMEGGPRLQLFDGSFAPCAATLPPEVGKKLERQALDAFAALGGRGYARVDFMLDRANNPWLLEMNAVPGLKDGSFYPFAAGLAGLSLAEICAHILHREGVV